MMERVRLSAVALVIVSVLLGSFVGVAGGFRVAPEVEVEMNLPPASGSTAVLNSVLRTMSEPWERGFIRGVKDEFSQGETMYIYLFLSASLPEFPDLVVLLRPDEDGPALRVEYSLTTPEGTVVAFPSDFGGTSQHARARERANDTYFEFQDGAYLRIDESWVPGEYTLTAKVYDLIFGLAAEKATTIRLIEGTG